MAFYDIQRILDEADSLTVAQFLGIEYSHRGKNFFIRCPGHEKRLGHEDNHLSNAWLTPKGYRCAACGVSVSLIDMVREVENCDFKEALALIADSLGGRSFYETTGVDSSIEREKTLSEDDLILLGLRSSVSFDVVHNAASTKSEVLEYAKTFKESEDEDIKKINIYPKFDDASWDIKSDESTWLAAQHRTFSLKSLLQDDPVSYYFLIKNKAQEAMEKYKKWVDNIEDKKSEEYIMLLPVIEILKKHDVPEENTIFSFKEIFTDYYNRCREIYLSISDEMIEDEKEFKEEKEEPKMRLDLFDNV